MLFCALLLELAKEKTMYTVDLSAGKLLQADDPSKDFAYDAEERYASVVVVVIYLAFVRIEGNDLPPSCPVVLLLLASTGRGLHIMETIRWFCSASSGRGDPIAAWGLARGQAINGLPEVFQRQLCVQLTHGRLAVDGING